MKNILIAASLATMLIAQPVVAEESYNHFPAVESSDLQSALCNIRIYNEKLSGILNQAKLTNQDMVKIHELTYTLENAINYLKTSLDITSVRLEDLHKASERLDTDVIGEAGKEYLARTSGLKNQHQCK